MTTPRPDRRLRQIVQAGLALVLTFWAATPIHAQLDPLLFLKRVPPNVILVVDTSAQMLEGDRTATRLDVAKKGIAQSAAENAGIGGRWSVVGLRDETSDRSSSGVLLPFGTAAARVVDAATRPADDPEGLRVTTKQRSLALALEDAMHEIKVAFSTDHRHGIDCRNTVVVLIAAGPETNSDHDPSRVAAHFEALPSEYGTRRVPVYVVGVMLDGGERELRSVAEKSGGQYFDASTPADVARAINVAIQSAYARSVDYDRGAPSEFQPVGPIVGTVDLTNARSDDGGRLSATRVTDDQGAEIRQTKNVIVTAGFELNSSRPAGIEGVVRAFRAFRPVVDDSRPSGYAFVSDGTPLWPNVDDRLETRGRARTPRNSADRNIFTYVPGHGMLSFSLSNASLLSKHLGEIDAEALIPFVRELPLGPVVGSTPALMEPPSQEPPPDSDY